MYQGREIYRTYSDDQRPEYDKKTDNRNIINENIKDDEKNVIGNSYDSIRLTKAIDNSDLHISDNHIIGKAANKKSTKIPLGKTHF